jgi:hypothetical protein
MCKDVLGIVLEDLLITHYLYNLALGDNANNFLIPDIPWTNNIR